MKRFENETMRRKYQQKAYHRQEKFKKRPITRSYSKTYKFGRRPPRKVERGLEVKQRLREGILSLFWKTITFPFQSWRKKPRSVDKAEIKERWDRISQMMKHGGEANFRAAVLEMDKIFFLALGRANFRGEVFAERLREARKTFSQRTYNDLWGAHAVRNKVVHGIDYEMTSFEAESARRRYEKGLRELHIL